MAKFAVLAFLGCIFFAVEGAPLSATSPSASQITACTSDARQILATRQQVSFSKCWTIETFDADPYSATVVCAKKLGAFGEMMLKNFQACYDGLTKRI